MFWNPVRSILFVPNNECHIHEPCQQKSQIVLYVVLVSCRTHKEQNTDGDGSTALCREKFNEIEPVSNNGVMVTIKVFVCSYLPSFTLIWVSRGLYCHPALRTKQ